MDSQESLLSLKDWSTIQGRYKCVNSSCSHTNNCQLLSLVSSSTEVFIFCSCLLDVINEPVHDKFTQKVVLVISRPFCDWEEFERLQVWLLEKGDMGQVSSLLQVPGDLKFRTLSRGWCICFPKLHLCFGNYSSFYFIVISDMDGWTVLQCYLVLSSLLRHSFCVYW